MLRNPVRTAFVVACLTPVAVLAGCGSSASTTTTTAAASTTTTLSPAQRQGEAVVAAAVAATMRQKSLHFEEVAGRASNLVKVIGDVSATTGTQTIVITTGSKVGHLQLILTGNVAYFKGDVAGLEGFTQFTSTLATRFAGKWISVPKSNAGFPSVSGTLTVAGAATNLVKIPGSLVKGATSTQVGVAVVAVHASQTSSSGSLHLTEYVETASNSLPVLVVGTTDSPSTGTRSITATFTKWGEVVKVVAPSGAVPIATVEAAATTTTTTTTPSGSGTTTTTTVAGG